MTRVLLPLLIALLCMGASCQRRPDPPRVVTVVVEKTVEVPRELTADCGDEAPREQTWREGVRLANVRHAYLDACTARMRQIRALGTVPR